MSRISPKTLRDLVQDVSKQQRRSFTSENRVLAFACQDPKADPGVIAERYTECFGDYNGEELTRNGVIRAFRRCRLADAEREQIFAKAIQLGEKLAQILDSGTGTMPPTEGNSQRKRLALLMMAERSKLVKKADAYDTIFRLNRTFAAECFDNLVDLLHPAPTPITQEEKEQREVVRMRVSLERTNKLLRDLQESFDEQLAESRQEEQEKFMSLLNSDKYGHILDLLAVAQNGFYRMRREKKPVPIELRNIQTLVRRLLEFVEDCGVTSMQEVGMRMNMNARQLDSFQFEGTPFLNEQESKTVEVISPGWQIPDRHIIISFPRVREIREEKV